MLPDALGSVRQEADATGTVMATRGWSPYGEELGGAQNGLGYTGEWFDAGVGLTYLRARWYDGATGRFTSQDAWEGDLYNSMSLNPWLYVYANPIMLVDPSGHYPLDDIEKAHIKKLKRAYLDSAERHNQIRIMDTNSFAALIAATIIDENRISPLKEEDKKYIWLENASVDMGCIVSGYYLKEVCYDNLDASKCWAYINNELPDGHPLAVLASVGIGNIKLHTAANVWRGQVCRAVKNEQGIYVDECIEARTNPLQQTRRFLWWKKEVDIPNPFETDCEDNTCGVYDPTKATAAYQTLAQQLRDDKINIEYAAASLEQGAIRALSLGIEPSGFNVAAWYKRGVQTDTEIGEGWNAGSAIFIVRNVPKVLDVWGLSTSWDLSMEKQYEPWYEKCKAEPSCSSWLD